VAARERGSYFDESLCRAHELQNMMCTEKSFIIHTAIYYK